MNIQSNGLVRLVTMLTVASSAFVAACSSDDTSKSPSEETDTSANTPTDPAPTSSSDDPPATAPAGSSSETDAGGAGENDAGGASGSDAGLKANGEKCKDASECQSNACFVGGKSSYCTAQCTPTGKSDPVCEALGKAFTGSCNNKGYCQAK